MSNPKIKIVLNMAGRGTVEINGFPLSNVTALNVSVRAGELNRVSLELIGDVEIECEPSVINAELLGIPLKIVSGKPRKP